jgi:hypothetical protein
MNGSNLAGQPGVYGTPGTAAPGNAPGARYSAVSWIDPSGNFWLFGGFGYDSTGAQGNLNDLWEYSGGQWAWMRGSNLVNQAGVNGTQGIAAPGNVPGARYGAAGWVDASGDLWLFGGAINQTEGFNDLWKYSGGQWTWVGANGAGSYGTMGVSSSTNLPPPRNSASTWTDSSGNLWLFGGEAGFGVYSDLWKYSAGEWTWMSGRQFPNEPGFYGIQGIGTPSTYPAGRSGGASWIDASGDLWLYGGTVQTPGIFSNSLDDLWEYRAGEWTWEDGMSGTYWDQPAIYGTQGTGSSNNTPGSRWGAASWRDSSGNLWLFGGAEYGELNDLWEYQP